MAVYENAAYVRTQVTGLLLRMMETADYQSIRISELVRRSKVSRSSFYRNFADKDDVLRRHLQCLTEKWGRSFEAESEKDLSGSLICHFMDITLLDRLICTVVYAIVRFTNHNFGGGYGTQKAEPCFDGL